MDVTPQIVENAEAGRFELIADGQVISIADYIDRDGEVVIPHVGTDPALRGNGYAGQLMQGVMETLEATGRTITPVCPYAAAWIRRNPTWHSMVTE